MKQIPEEQTPMLDMDVPVILKVRDLIKLNQILARTYDEEESLRETLSPILQEIKAVIHEIESNEDWSSLTKWDSGGYALEKAVSKQNKHLKRIKQALLKGRTLRISYCSPGSGEITRRTIIPLDLWESDSFWLLRAYCYLKGEEVTFRVDRILKVKQKSSGRKMAKPPIGASESRLSVTSEHGDAENMILDGEIDPFNGTAEALSGETESDYSEEPLEEPYEDFQKEFQELGEPDPENRDSQVEGIKTNRRGRHYSLPGKKPHQSGLPNRLERLIKRVERKSP